MNIAIYIAIENSVIIFVINDIYYYYSIKIEFRTSAKRGNGDICRRLKNNIFKILDIFGYGHA